jgi:peptide deformylase
MAIVQTSALLLNAESRKSISESLDEYGIDRVLEQQTPACPTATFLLEEAEQLTLSWLLKFAQHNKYIKLAGLAANQCAIKGERVMLKACVVLPYGEQPIVAVNPEIIEKRAPSYYNKEGCLTWPGKIIKALRYSEVVVRYNDPQGAEHTRESSGFEATVWQHEINHLNGVEELVTEPVKYQKPNERCACGSGKKHKKCCGR